VTQTGVEVCGHGVAALAAAAVLGRAGIPISLADTPSPARLVTLNRPTQDLLADLFGQGVLRGLAPSGGRVVDWETASAATRIEDDALVTDLAVLLARMREHLALTRHPPPTPVIRIMAGGREANARLAAAPPLATCYWQRLRLSGQQAATIERAGQYIRAGEHGWTFIAARPTGGWFAQATVFPADRARAAGLLAEAAGLASDHNLPAPDGWIDTAPSLGSAVGLTGELRAGDAATAYDPLCGDGCGHALRSGVLAAAVAVRALDYPEEVKQLHSWYRNRLRLSFVRHLESCAELLGRARLAEHWQDYRVALLRLAKRQKLLGWDSIASYRLVNAQLIPDANATSQGLRGTHPNIRT